MIKKTIASALVGLGIAQMHFQYNQLGAEETSYEDPCCIMGHEPLDPCCVNEGYPLPGAIHPECSWDFYVKGDFIYWSNLAPLFGNIGRRVDTLTGANTTNLFMSHHYRPGFRVSAGTEVNGVVLDVTYTRYHAHLSSTFTAGPNQAIQFVFYPLPELNNVNFSSYNPHLNFDVDMLFVSAQKPIYTGKAFIISLNYALFIEWQSQKYRINATTSAPLPAVAGLVTTEHKGFYAGPDLGVKAIALLPWGFEMLAQIDLSGGVAYMHKGFSTASFPGALPPSTLKTHGHVMHLQAYHNGEIGLGWSDFVWCDRYRIHLEATYNFFYKHVFSFGTFENMTLTSYSIHGWAFGGRLDF